jgi:hypothetical protein
LKLAQGFGVATLAVISILAGGACVDLKPGRCNGDSDCPSGTRCDLDPTPQGNGRCVPKGTDGGDAASDGDGGIEATPGDGSSDQAEAEVTPACTATSCTGAAPICDGTSKACRACGAGSECVARNTATPICATTGACVECAMSTQCGVSTKPICEANACRACSTDPECAARDPKLPACATTGASSGTCVECTESSDCKVTGKPVCNVATNTCRACKADSECPADPGVCMEDGHCATVGEVIFVEKTSRCPATDSDGSSAKPYCTPNEGVLAMTVERHVIVIEGAASEKMTIATTAKRPVIIGRSSVGGGAGSLPAVTDTALTISSDEVLVRDLAANIGSAPTSRGILVTGGAKALLRRVSVDLGMGLGIEVSGGASLTMDRCTVLNNSKGGVLINDATYDIQNSIIAKNGVTGVKFTSMAVATGSQFAFNTVVATSGNAVSCEPSKPQAVTASLVDGGNDSCTLTNSVTVAPSLSTATYHLTGHQACPAAPATFPDHDIDGDPRVAPIDCGADQYVP